VAFEWTRQRTLRLTVVMSATKGNEQSGHPLASCMNFRDLGGLAAARGRVAPGRLFRTAHLSELDERAAEHLCQVLRIGAYIDFREEHETARDGAPSHLVARGVRWVRHPFDIADEPFRALRRPNAADWEALYFRAMLRLAPVLAGAIRLIAQETAPVVFGCWVGKDRTGMVAALSLALLEVDDATIAADYARTTALLMPFKSRFAFLWQGEPEAADEVFEAYNTAQPEIMAGFLRQVRAHFGSVEQALALEPAVVETLRARYLLSR
jgi:protein-tyrosine phosphatase